MWQVTRWVLIWLRITVLLALGLGAAWMWCPPGWFPLCVITAGLAQVWLIRQLVREWSWRASATWWWSR